MHCFVPRDGQGRAALHWATNLNLVDVLNCILTMPEASTDQLEPGEKDMSEEPGLCRTDFSVEKASLLELQVRNLTTEVCAICLSCKWVVEIQKKSCSRDLTSICASGKCGSDAQLGLAAQSRPDDVIKFAVVLCDNPQIYLCFRIDKETPLSIWVRDMHALMHLKRS